MTERELRLGDSSLYAVANDNDDVRNALYERVIEWIEQNGIAATSGEAIMQDDDCQITAPELLGEIVDNILEAREVDRMDIG